MLMGIDDIAFCTLTSKDVVRHPLVQKIVQAYETFEAREERGRQREKERTGRSVRYGRKS